MKPKLSKTNQVPRELGPDDALHTERARYHDAREQSERQGHFIAHALSRTAQRSEMFDAQPPRMMPRMPTALIAEMTMSPTLTSATKIFLANGRTANEAEAVNVEITGATQKMADQRRLQYLP